MICTTIQNRTLEQIYEALENCEMAEIRLDRCELTPKEIEELFTADVPLVATCRISEVAENEPSLQAPEITAQSREIKAMQIAERKLVRAIEAGARYVDVELEAPKQMSKRVRSAAHENGTVFVRSYHDFEGTDSLEALKAIVEKCHYHGADMVKIVTTANSEADAQRVLALYDWYAKEFPQGGLVAFCMGEEGRQSRLDCIGKGAPYTYAALSADEAAAPGQWPADEMRKAIYGDFRFIEGCDEPLTMPVSKSFAQRAIIAAALADGTSVLRGYTPCGDNEAAVAVARNLGAEVTADANVLTVKGISASLGSLDLSSLHVGESGLLTRMMIPVMAQLCPGSVAFTGEKTLLGRPLTGAKEIMKTFEAEISSDGSEEEDVPVKVPLEVCGPLKAGRAEISGKHGSQLISGLLMALPFAEKNSSLIVHQPKSIPYMFITLEVLKKFGVKVGNDMLGGRDFIESNGDWSLCTEMVFKVKGGQKYKAAEIDLEGDWSAAANFLVAAAVFGQLELQGLDTTSLQADLSIMDILMDAGASLSQLDGDKGNITVQRAPLKAFDVDASNCPDLFPIISVLASFCKGTSRLSGVGRLANKESDRAKAIVEMLTSMGVDVHIEGDIMFIEGHTLADRLMNSSLLKGGQYSSHHDHRMVMALKVAELGADAPIVIDDETCVAKSFPQFHDIFAAVERKLQ
jgi:3-phosphoshikimate 1-carboxyvinyltransferase